MASPVLSPMASPLDLAPFGSPIAGTSPDGGARELPAPLLCPMTLAPNMGPLSWTPSPADDVGPELGVVSKEITYYDWTAWRHVQMTPAEMANLLIVGCRGGSPRAIEIAWTDAPSEPRAKPRAFRECVLSDALSLADLTDVVAAAYYRTGQRPPRGMTLRWILTDQLHRLVRLEFKSHAQVLAEHADDATADATADAVATVAPRKKRALGDAIAAAPIAAKRWSSAATADVLAMEDLEL